MIGRENRYLRLADGWREIARDAESELAVIRSEQSGFMRVVALVDAEDHDLGEYWRLDGPAIRPGPGEGDEIAFAKKMLGKG